ncbi:MAG: adenylate/guanylate cyclase domain-containing protein [Candidatus Eremiobacteraeota bacterium]|nr:adenylate/guanylate cyclase domain-containing protein [Candidatus Eremiobacteraeota bacterium]
MIKKPIGKKINIVYLACALVLILIFAFLPISTVIDNYMIKYKLLLYNAVRGSKSYPDDKIALVEIDDISAKEYSFPFSYSIHSKFLKKCKKAGVKGVVFLSTPGKDNNNSKSEKALIKQLEAGPSVFWGLYFIKNFDGNGNLKMALPSAKLLNRARGRGVVMQNAAGDKILRSKKLGMKWGEKVLPSIELEVAAYLKGIPRESINFTKRNVYMKKKRIPTDGKYNYFFIPGKKSEFRSFKFNEIMGQEIPPGLSGKTLLVGRVYDDQRGYVAVPLPMKPKYSSLQTTAKTVNSIVRGNYIMNFPRWVDLMIMIYMAIFIGWLITSLKTKKIISFSIFIIVIYMLANIAIFMLGYNYSLSAVLLMIVSFVGVVLIYRSLQLNSLIRKFVPSQLISTLSNNDLGTDFETKVRPMTVLFADIKGYTTLAERYNPAVILDMLDEYTKMINKIVDKNGGLMFNYQGDGLLAIFGLGEGESLEKGANNAVKSAGLIQNALKSLRRQWRMEYRELFIVGTGISTGDVAIGLMGTDTYSQYVAIGDTVNMAARLQALGKDLRSPILIDDETFKLCKNRSRVRFIKDIHLKGKFKCCKAYEVIGNRIKTPTTHPGINVDDDMETAVLKKIEFYREQRRLPEV